MFDVESYIARYAPHSETRLQRLLCIAQHAPSQSVALHAYRLLEEQLKDAGNDVMYQQVFDPNITSSSADSGDGDGDGGEEEKEDIDIVGLSASMEYDMESSAPARGTIVPNDADTHMSSQFGIDYDASFTSHASQSFHAKLQTLETNLSTAQSHLSKEAIRIAISALASHYTQSGRLKEGLVKFIRCKDYCMNTRQATEICWEICVRAIHAKNYSCAKDHVTRLERSSDPSARAASLRTSGGGGGGADDGSGSGSGSTGVVATSTSISSDPQALFTSQLQVVKGLLALVEGKLEEAAKLFLNISGEFQSQFTNLLSAEDVALYGGLLGLTTLHRDELNSLVMNDVVQERLELVPQLRDAIRLYKRADYGACLNLVQGLQELVELDLYLAPHAKKLFSLVREKCICQYFAPYTSVSLETMRESFGFPSTDHVEHVLLELIESKRIVGARIDIEDGTLSVCTDTAGVERRARRSMMRKIAKMGDGLVAEIEHLVLRQSCLEHGLEVKGEKGPKMKKSWAPAGLNWKGDISSDEDDTPMMDLDRFNWA